MEKIKRQSSLRSRWQSSTVSSWQSSRKNIRKSSRKGSTMVSVMAAFVILMIAVAMLYTAVMTSLNLLTRARKNDTQTVEALEQFYSTYEELTTSDKVITLTPTVANGRYQGFTVKGKLHTTQIDLSAENGTRARQINICHYQYAKYQTQTEAE